MWQNILEQRLEMTMVSSQSQSTILNECALFDERIIRKIHELTTQKCHYGKDLQLLLNPRQGFKAHYNNEFVAFENFFELHPDAQGQMRGVCWPLTFILGKYLQHNLNLSEQYVIAAASGNCPDFFANPASNHTYILMWPRSLDHKIRPLLQASKTGKEIPENCLLVCPSFQVMGFAHEVAGFTFKSIDFYFDVFPDAHPTLYTTVKSLPFLQNVNQTPPFPIGYVRDLIPENEISEPLKPEHLIFMVFVKAENQWSPHIELCYQDKDSFEGVFHWVDWRKHVSSDDVLGQWILKIERDFRQPDQQDFCNKYTDVIQSANYAHLWLSNT